MKSKEKAYVEKKTKTNLETTHTTEQTTEATNHAEELTEDAQLQIFADIIIHVLLKQVK